MFSPGHTHTVARLHLLKKTSSLSSRLVDINSVLLTVVSSFWYSIETGMVSHSVVVTKGKRGHRQMTSKNDENTEEVGVSVWERGRGKCCIPSSHTVGHQGKKYNAKKRENFYNFSSKKKGGASFVLAYPFLRILFPQKVIIYMHTNYQPVGRFMKLS